jgi:hypothetical protein
LKTTTTFKIEQPAEEYNQPEAIDSWPQDPQNQNYMRERPHDSQRAKTLWKTSIVKQN